MRRTSNRSQHRIFREKVLSHTPKNAKVRRILRLRNGRVISMKIFAIYGSNMVLQRGKKNIIAGQADAGESVSVLFQGRQYTAITDANGVWSIEIPPVVSKKDHGPFEMVVSSSKGDTVRWENIVFGDIFLLGGQSNMELPLERTRDCYGEEIDGVMDPDIRMFQVEKVFDFSGEDKILESGEWICAAPETAKDFSAVGYFFAKMYRGQEDVPVGLVHTAVGGAPVEAFMSEANIRNCAEKIKASRDLKCICDGNKNMGCIFCYEKMFKEDKDPEYIARVQENDRNRIAAWHEELDKNDPGIKEGWLGRWEKCDDTITVPGFFIGTKYEKYLGSLWLQKAVHIPESMTRKEGVLALGTLVDSDKTYLNGTLAGATEYKYPPRRYALKKGALKAGENIITVRLCMDSNIGGAVPDMPYYIKAGDEEVSLEGEWQLRKGYACEKLEGETFFIWHPAALFHSMIASIKDMSFKAVLFYQGESNCGYPEYYADMLTAMVEEWRGLFGEPLPFFMVEIPYFLGEGPEYTDDPFTGIRKAQHEAVKGMDNVYLAEIYDLGQYNELHPQNKKDVAKRLFDLYKNKMMEEE